MNRKFIENKIQVTPIHVKRCLVSFTTEEMHIEK